MRVLLVPNTYLPKVGGVEEVTRQLARELTRRGHHVGVVTNRWQGVGCRDEVEGIAVRRVRLPLPRSAGLARFALQALPAAAMFLFEIRRFRPDVVHVVAAGPAVVYLSALRFLVGAPVVLTSQGEVGVAPHRIFKRSRALRWGLRRLLAEAAAVTTCSEFVLDELRSEFGGVFAGEVIPNGVDLAELDVAPAAEAPYLFAAGRLVDQKGFDVLLRAFAQTAGELQLLIAGEGRERASLEALAKERGIESCVRWLGVASRARLAALLKGAEVVVVPSRKEPFGVILLEAMAAGRSTVASRVGGIPEFAQDGETTLLVPPEDPDALAAALVRLAADRELRERLGRNATAVADAYSSNRIADRYEELYKRAR